MAGPVLLTLARVRRGIVFLDPPYALAASTGGAGFAGRAPPQLTMVQHSVRLSLQESYGALEGDATAAAGDNALSFYAAESAG